MKLLHDVENNKWYNENGDSFSSDNPAMPYGNSERVIIQLYAEVKGANSGSESVEDWIKYTGFSGNGYGAILATDNNFLHWYKAQLSTALSAGTIATGMLIDVATGVSAENISETGSIYFYNANGDTEAIAYSSRKAISGGIQFTAAEGNVLEHSYAVNDQTDIPEMLYAEAAMLSEESDPENGLFVFDFVCDSPKLRNRMQYSSIEMLEDCKGLELTVFQTNANNTVSIRKRFRCNTFRITGGIADIRTGIPIRSHEENQIVALVNAMIASGLSIQFSADGENWNDTQSDEDEYIRMRLAGNGAWSSAVRLPSGRPGENGITPHIDNETKHWMLGEQDTGIRAEGMPGTPGEGQDGKSAYELAVDAGYEGTVEEWLADLKGADGADGIADAPEDGNLYARCNGKWVRITGTAEEPEEQTIPTALYGVIADGETYAVSQVTAEMLASMSSAELTSDVTATLNVTPGSVSVILVPAGYEVKKDDGFGNKVPFDENNGTLGTGANGASVTLGGTAYKSYGEFNLITGQTIIYIQQEN